MAPLPDPAGLQLTYERQAQTFDAQRGRSPFEAAWLDRFAAHLPPKARVLDLGCGAGEPIAQWLIAKGYDVTGLDFSTNMLAIARARWPEGDWREGDMRDLDEVAAWDGIIGWNSLFHLSAEDQRACLPRLARALTPTGALMLSVGHSHGEVAGTVGDEQVYHASLSPAEYANLLDANDMQLRGFIAEDETCNNHTVLLARRTPQGDKTS